MTDPQTETQRLITELRRSPQECVFGGNGPEACVVKYQDDLGEWCDWCCDRIAADALEAQAAEIATLREERDTALQCQSAYDAITRAIAEAVGEGDPSGPYWADGVRFIASQRDELQAEVATLRAKLAEANARLAECYRLTGADPDGDNDAMLASHAVDEVRRLREEYDEAERREV